MLTVRKADFAADHTEIYGIRFAVFVDEQSVPEDIEAADSKYALEDGPSCGLSAFVANIARGADDVRPLPSRAKVDTENSVSQAKSSSARLNRIPDFLRRPQDDGPTAMAAAFQDAKK